MEKSGSYDNFLIMKECFLYWISIKNINKHTWSISTKHVQEVVHGFLKLKLFRAILSAPVYPWLLSPEFCKYLKETTFKTIKLIDLKTLMYIWFSFCLFFTNALYFHRIHTNLFCILCSPRENGTWQLTKSRDTNHKSV